MDKKIDVDRFVSLMKNDLDLFAQNMKNLHKMPLKRFDGDWLESFLAWAEWETEMDKHFWTKEK